MSGVVVTRLSTSGLVVVAVAGFDAVAVGDESPLAEFVIGEAVDIVVAVAPFFSPGGIQEPPLS